MAMQLFAHLLRGATLRWGPDDPGRSPEPRHWVFGELVVRRDGYAPWGLLWRATPTRGEATTRREATAEPLWADTQPWCHE